MSLRRRPSLVLAIATVISACGSFGGGVVPENAAVVRFVNATSFAVEVRVNGAPRGVIQPWTPVQELAVFGPDGPPWQVEFFDPDGLQLAGVEVDGPAGAGEGSASSQSSSCGTFSVWWGIEPDDVPVVDADATRPPPPPCD